MEVTDYLQEERKQRLERMRERTRKKLTEKLHPT